MNQDVKRLITEMKKAKAQHERYCLVFARVIDHVPSDDKPILFQKFVPEFLQEADNLDWVLQTAYPEVDGFAEALTGRTVFVFRRA